MTYKEAAGIMRQLISQAIVLGRASGKPTIDRIRIEAICKAVEALEKQATQEWISVDDRLPQDDSDALAYLSIGEESRICPANYAKGVWFDCIFGMPVTESVTHWMPMPQPPKGE